MDDKISSVAPQKARAVRANKELIIHYRINFKYICLCTVSIPLGALIVCLVSAYIFQFDDVHETHCRVFNIVPSISAVTGVSPQRYIWRMSVALHIGPRVIISAVYNAYQLSMINPLAEQELKSKAQLWLNTAYLLNLIETGALCGVTYISNRENYPVHEKLFITFMVSSLTYMVACIQGTKIAAESRNDLESVKAGLKFKKDMLILSIFCTVGLVVFFLQHRFFCFRLGSTDEYGYKYTVADDQLDIFEIWKQFPIDVFAGVKNISLRCLEDHQKILDGVASNDLNSLKLFDATAKPAAGILSGNINQYGDFDQCLEVPEAQYCLALINLGPIWREPLSQYKDLVHSYFSIKETFDDPAHRVPGSTFARWGFCIPKGCTHEDLTNALAETTGVEAKVRPNMCQLASSPLQKLSWPNYLAIVYFVFIIALVGTSTLFYKSVHQKKNVWYELLTFFAIQRNCNQLFTVSHRSNEYQSVHGVRFFSALALLMAHKTMASLYNPYINKTKMAESQAMEWSVIGRNAIIYTDCFLIISGLLNAKALFADLEKHQKILYKEKLVNRLFRIFPGLITVIVFCTYILPSLGSGPLWPLVVNHHSELCKKYMWRNFLLIHNWFGFDTMCLTHTHQIGIDMQLFLVSPVFVYLLWKSEIIGLWVIGCTALISTILRFYTTFYYHLSYVVHFGIPISRMFDTADYSYILPTHRATIYLMGIVLASLLRGTTTMSFSKRKRFCIWVLAYFMGLTTWFVPFPMAVREYEYNSLQAALYGAIYPFTWGSAVAWVVYAVETGFGSWFTPLLTWKYFQIFTKIAYGVYLIQFPVFFYNVGITRHVQEFKHYMMLPPVETIIILLLAILLTLFVEMPFQNVHKRLVRGQSSKNSMRDKSKSL